MKVNVLDTYSAAPESWMVPAQHRVARIQGSDCTANLIEACIALTADHLGTGTQCTQSNNVFVNTCLFYIFVVVVIVRE